MREHGVAPDDFLDFVHDIDLSSVDRNEALVDRLKALPASATSSPMARSNMRSA